MDLKWLKKYFFNFKTELLSLYFAFSVENSRNFGKKNFMKKKSRVLSNSEKLEFLGVFGIDLFYI